MKLLTVTWSYTEEYDYVDSFLYKSFIKHNSKDNFINIHFNRNLYLKLEEDFKQRFGYQYEYILYKIFLLEPELKNLKNISVDNVVIYADTNDVACLGNISELNTTFDSNSIVFSSERHKYPSQHTPWNKYPEHNEINSIFLNSGLFIGSTSRIHELLQKCIDKVLCLEYKDFGGDQGVYTYAYINNIDNIILDHDSRVFLSTYLRAVNDFECKDNRLINKSNNLSPLFIHDNGWNHGSPKFIEKFKLI